MFKLLTEEERQKVAREYVAHRVVVMLSTFVLVLSVGIIGLLPSYVLSNARQSEVLERVRIMNSSGQQKGDELELQAWLIETTKKLQALSPELDTDRPSDFIDKVLSQRTMGVRITSFLLAKVKDKTTLSIGGIASDRQALIRLEDRINTSGYFSEVVLPVSNLAKDKDIDFQIKFSPAPPQKSTQTP